MVPAAAAREQPADRIDVLAQVQRINAALVRWDLWEWNQGAPEGVRRDVPVPPLSRGELKALRSRLLKQLPQRAG